MKRSSVLIVIFLWAGSLALPGQGIAGLGVKAGISLANQNYRFTPIDYTMETEPVWGPAVAIFVEAFSGDHFSFQGDISYALKGCSSSTRSVTVNHMDQDRVIVNEGEVSKSTFRYLSFAPMVRYRIGQGSLVPYFLLGPRVDVLLKYQTSFEYPLAVQNSIIIGLSCGAGLEFRLQQAGLFTELQYLPDLSPVTGEDPLRVTNNIVSITLGVRYLISD